MRWCAKPGAHLVAAGVPRTGPRLRFLVAAALGSATSVSIVWITFCSGGDEHSLLLLGVVAGLLAVTAVFGAGWWVEWRGEQTAQLAREAAQLRRTLEDLNRIHRIAGIGSTIENLATGHYTWSPGACAIFGVDPDAVQPTTEYIRQFYHPADRDKVVKAAQEARLCGVPAPPLQYRIVRPDGAVRTVYRENAIEYDSSGYPTRRIVTFKDVTELKAAEDRLRASQQHLARAQRVASTGSFELDLRTGALEWSDETYRIFGLGSAGAPINRELLVDIIIPEDRPLFEAQIAAVSGGQEHAVFEYRIRHSDGSIRTLHRELELVRDAENRPSKIFGVVKDITELKLAEQRQQDLERQLRDGARRYRLLSEHSADMIVSFDPYTQQRSYVSPSCRRLYGYQPEEAMKLHASEIIHHDDYAEVVERLRRLLEDGDQTPVTYRGKRKDGSYVWVEASLTRLLDPETGAPEIVSVVRDVSERVRYEAALRASKEQADTANRAKSAFLGTVSHELRTPLNAIIGFTDMILSEVLGPLGHERYRSYIADVHTSAMHLLNLINEILDFSKIEAGMLELHEEVFDASECIRGAVRLIGPRIKEGGLAAEIDLPATLPALRADERKTRQVLYNLLSNAVKFTPPGGRINIAARFNRATGLRVTVADTGIGIAPEQIHQIFEPFTQVDSTLGRKHDGTGLGLPIVKAIMERHEGWVELKSDPGRGTSVSIVFPASRMIRGKIRKVAAAAVG